MKVRKELWFGFGLMGVIVVAALWALLGAEKITQGHLGLLMLSLVVVAIMLGFPTAFTLMGMGMIFAWFAYERDIGKTLDLMVASAFKSMSNDVLISIPLFVFMGYLVERANLIEKLFRSLHLMLVRLPGALAVATLVTCTIFATATGIVGAVVTLMGLLALPQMLRAGYSVRLSAGVITAGGCLGILIPPSVLLIVYGATAGVSVVQLYAGAFFPGLMLASLYIGYVILLAKLKPSSAPPLPESERYVPLPPQLEKIAPSHAARALPVLLRSLIQGLKGSRNADVSTGYIIRQLFVVLLPALLFVFVALTSYISVTTVSPVEELPEAIGQGYDEERASYGLAEPEGSEEEEELQEMGSSQASSEAEEEKEQDESAQETAAASEVAPERIPAPMGWWISFAVGLAALAVYYAVLSFTRFEVFKMLLSSFFPLLILILAVLGSIVFGLATPTEAAAVGALGGFLLAAAYRQLTFQVVKESVFLTAKTSAMVCWLFVGSAIFSAAFALLGGQDLVEQWVLSLDLTKTQFLILTQIIIFLLGWPLEWTEIIVIFMPIFIPLLDHFGVDPLFFGLLVALNLQTAFLSPPVAMSAFYLKGVSPPHVTLNQIFLGMMPFMGIQILAIVILYNFPGIGLWLPQLLYN